MDLNISKLKDLDIEELDPGKFIDNNAWATVVKQLKELKIFIDEMVRIIQIKDIIIPDIFRINALNYAESFVDIVNKFTQKADGTGVTQVKQKQALVAELNGLYMQWLLKVNEQPGQVNFLDTYSTLRNLDYTNANEELAALKKLKSESKEYIDGEKAKLEELMQDVLSDKTSLKTIMDEAQISASKITISDYAKIFETDSKNSNIASYIWLGVGFVVSIAFIWVLIVTKGYEKLNTESLINIGESKIVKYHISAILVKGLLIAVQIYLISFSFRQYSINKHLATLNKHRENAFNSFKLFIESISKDDTSTRNNLMLQLAKSVYDHVSSGYIGDKDQKVNSGIVEITKMMDSVKG